MGFSSKFFKAYFILLCINGMFLVFDGVAEGSNLGVAISSPFDNSDVTAISTPNFYNSTDQSNTVYSNVTGSINNSTGGYDAGDFLNPIDTILYPIQIVMTVVNLLTGAFVFDAIASFGFPPIFVQVMQGLLGFMSIFAVLKIVTNRNED